ncbi:hypothetical protein HPP92_023741 [Vanilla planifolia]|uniref:Clp R domain-containing protein n=1 Tax=Vanilla planifolia TaxID=51239 RepID=A0A835PS15_VANPL|nr:hypothetical protein HPP92_023741 [Vanilla planifolia]
MPTSVSAARQCLAGDSSIALDAAVTAARRRSHAQTTSLHVIFALLSSSSPSLLRDALSRARSSAYPHRLQFKALELCFGVALDRLPSSSSTASLSEADDPPVSNSLMAAIKRSQANQRRHPDTFHLYHQQSPLSNQSQTFSGVKVELQQLVLAILDDPIVSRVFGEAGFSSCDIKLAVLRPPPPILRFSRAARCPPLFLSNFSFAEGFGYPLCPLHVATDDGEDNCRRIAEVMVRKLGASRNLMLVGIGAAEAAGDFAQVVKKKNWSMLPLEIRGVSLLSFENELGSGDQESICARLEKVVREADEDGVVVSIGDLNGLVEGSKDVVGCLVSELTKVVEMRQRRFWIIGWSATYETYLKFLSRYPMVDKDWDLQLLPITSYKTAVGGLLPKPTSLMDSFVPFGGFFPQAHEYIGALNQSLPRCQYCNEKYEQEVRVILNGSFASSEDQQSVDVVPVTEGLDYQKNKYDNNLLNTKVFDLQKKWNENCQHFHQCSQIVEAKPFQFLPHLVGIPFCSDKMNFNKLITASSISQSQCCFGNTLAASVGRPKTTTNQSIALSLATEQPQMDLVSKLQNKLSKSETDMDGRFRSQPVAVSDFSIHDGNMSPSSVNSVTTDLILGARSSHSPLEQKSVPEGSSRCSTPRKVNESTHCVSSVHLGTSTSTSLPNSPGKSSCTHTCSFSSLKAGSGVSPAEQLCHSQVNIYPKLDEINFKELYSGLLEKVGRQGEALLAITNAIFDYKVRNEKRHMLSLRGAIWLSFIGPDNVGKWMTGLALAELIFGSRDNLICIDLYSEGTSFYHSSIVDQQGSKNCSANLRGKTIIDYIAMEIRKKPLSVFFLENVDKADSLTQSSLSSAIRTGKFSDSHGREVNISNSIFITTAENVPGKAFSHKKENICFSEERILAIRRWKMKFLVETFSEVMDCIPSSRVSVTSRQELKKNAPQCSIFMSKRKLGVSNVPIEQNGYSSTSKKPHKMLGVVLDLNIPAEQELDQHGDCNSSIENNFASENPEDWFEEFFDLVDKAVNFQPYDFDAIADYLLKEISKGFCDIVGSSCTLEIDVKVTEQILAATWMMRNRSHLSCWIEKVLCRSLSELIQKHKLSVFNVFRLIAHEDLLIEESEYGTFLPSRILLE